MELTNTAWLSFREHVLSEWPNEACGLIAGDEFVPCENIAEDPLRTFKIASKRYLEVDADVGVQAVVHSHTHDVSNVTSHDRLVKKLNLDDRMPSGTDMETQVALGVPFGIVSTEGENVTKPIWFGEEHREPLIGRKFVHGIWDCYSLVRDYFKLERGIDLKEFPRDFNWWRGEDGKDPKNLYMEGFEIAGFKEINITDLEVGDGLIMQYRADVPNHAGVYIDNNQMLHHLFGHLSGIVPFDRWQGYVVKAVRYYGND